jgi:hypothetical protein
MQWKWIQLESQLHKHILICSAFEYLLLKPTDCIEELKPCNKCKDKGQMTHSKFAVRTELKFLR